MITVNVRLSDREYSKVKQLADNRHCSIDMVIKSVISDMNVPTTTVDPITGLFSDEPELMDRVVDTTMEARENYPLRCP